MSNLLERWICVFDASMNLHGMVGWTDGVQGVKRALSLKKAGAYITVPL